MVVSTTERKRSRRKGCLVAAVIMLAILVILGIGGAIACTAISKEHQEAASLPLDAVDFDRLKNDGVYHGLYEDGMYGWRYNECDVTVVNGRVTAIGLAGSKANGGGNADYEMLYDRVIEAQSLQVDAISGATLTSKAYLQCIENALLQAQRD